jgi:hypothetical protein
MYLGWSVRESKEGVSVEDMCDDGIQWCIHSYRRLATMLVVVVDPLLLVGGDDTQTMKMGDKKERK